MSKFWNSIHPKVIAATLGSLAASVVLGVIVSLQASPDLLGGLPPVIVFLITASIPALVTFLSGYVKKAPPETPPVTPPVTTMTTTGPTAQPVTPATPVDPTEPTAGP
jgi:hypothetical protein